MNNNKINRYKEYIGENFNPEEDRLYVIIYQSMILGCFTSDLKAKEAINTHINNNLSDYLTSDINIEEYRDKKREEYQISSLLADRLYDDIKID